MFTKKSYIVKAILFTLIGLLFILFPATISKYIMLFIGTNIILYGVINLVTSVKMDISYKLKLSIIICIIGVLFILLSGFILSVMFPVLHLGHLTLLLYDLYSMSDSISSRIFSILFNFSPSIFGVLHLFLHL